MKGIVFAKLGLWSVAAMSAAGVAAVPALTHAQSAADSTDATLVSQQHDVARKHPAHPMMGPVGDVTAVTVNEDGSGSLTMTLAQRPVHPETLPEDVLKKITDRIEKFQEKHPDFPKPGDSVTIPFTSDTKFMVDGKEVSASELSVGTTVRVLGANMQENSPAKVVTDRVIPPRGHHGHGAGMMQDDAERENEE